MQCVHASPVLQSYSGGLRDSAEGKSSGQICMGADLHVAICRVGGRQAGCDTHTQSLGINGNSWLVKVMEGASLNDWILLEV